MSDRCPTCPLRDVPLYPVPWSLDPVCALCAEMPPPGHEDASESPDPGRGALRPIEGAPTLPDPLAVHALANTPDLRAARRRLGLPEVMAPRGMHRPMVSRVWFRGS